MFVSVKLDCFTILVALQKVLGNSFFGPCPFLLLTLMNEISVDICIDSSTCCAVSLAKPGYTVVLMYMYVVIHTVRPIKGKEKDLWPS